MKGGKSPLGYTIIEVLIVLAVSGMMFLIAVNFVNGKQQKSAFQTGVNELASRIQDTINSVADGQYSDYPIGCSFDGTTTDTSQAAQQQGTNDSCVFLGKVMHFSVSNAPSQYEIINIAGGRAKTNGDPIVTLSEAKPAAIASLTSQYAIPQTLDLANMKTDTGINIYAFGFIQGLGTSSGRGAKQIPTLKYLDGVLQGSSTSQAESAVNSANLKNVSSVTLCITDSSRYATISVGFNNSQNNAVVKMLGSTPC